MTETLVNAVIVCADYADYLLVTLPYNRHHFKRVVVVTAPADYETTRVCLQNVAECLVTDAFFRDGDPFNKYRALEEGLDKLGRERWISIMDADVLWPKAVEHRYEEGRIYSPLRRMYDGLLSQLPHETYWKQYPHHRLHRHPRWHGHLSGYTQIFHASDPALGKPPWHRLDLPTAQGGDTYFQDLWPADRRVRPSWEVLHLGPARANWAGRKTPRAV